MPSLRDIRRRIRSIRNTAKITKAMELVAASRLRRAQMRVTAARPYSEAIRALVAELGALAPTGGEALHPLLVQREVRVLRPSRVVHSGLALVEIAP
jgi:F-type H+-transporting ATPase subunit gamma